jgi:uncharacterized protein with HEPN domain
MRPENRNPGTLLQMRLAAQRVIDFTKGTDLEAFKQDDLLQSAVQHQILIIGEAVSRLSPDFLQAHPEIPWMRIKRMRNTLIHRYDNVDLDIVWGVVIRDAPALIALITPILEAVSDSDLSGPSASQ